MSQGSKLVTLSNKIFLIISLKTLAIVIKFHSVVFLQMLKNIANLILKLLFQIGTSILNTKIKFQLYFRSVQDELKKMFKSYVSMGLFVLVWPLVPSFVCDCFFYVAMYFSPYQAAEQIVQRWRRR